MDLSIYLGTDIYIYIPKAAFLPRSIPAFPRALLLTELLSIKLFAVVAILVQRFKTIVPFLVNDRGSFLITGCDDASVEYKVNARSTKLMVTENFTYSKGFGETINPAVTASGSMGKGLPSLSNGRDILKAQSILAMVMNMELSPTWIPGQMRLPAPNVK